MRPVETRGSNVTGMDELHGPEALGALLKAWRDVHGLTQGAAADRLNALLQPRGIVARQEWVSRMEDGRPSVHPEVSEEIGELVGIGRDAGWRLAAGLTVTVELPAWTRR